MNEIAQLKETIIDVLKTIYDPEIPVDIWTLHLIYGLDVDADGNVHILMTVTAPNCPVAEEMPGIIKERIQAIMGVRNVEVELTFEPAWSIDMLSDEAKAELGLDGDYGNFTASDFLY
ncbi:MAG: DUF59 domain-containing protein [Bacteroidales bacterium]|nr:DUF59 domain-containing protein [Bacteroidales bacterium]